MNLVSYQCDVCQRVFSQTPEQTKSSHWFPYPLPMSISLRPPSVAFDITHHEVCPSCHEKLFRGFQELLDKIREGHR